jgi:hypothetical protein
MAVVGHLEAKMFTVSPQGNTGPLDLLQALSGAIDTGPQLVQIATGQTDQAVRIISATQGITTVIGFLIASDQDVTVKYNAGSVAIALNANGFHFLSGTSLTAVAVTNNSGSTANLRIWGIGN